MLRKLLPLIAGIGLCAVATAFINPSFSPIHLVQQSESVWALKVEAATKDGKVTATVVKALKGDKPAKPLILDLGYGTGFEAQGKEVAAMIDAGAKDGLLFVGQFEEGGGGGAQGPRGMLHIGGKWVVFNGNDDGSWDMVKIDANMLGTWAGSTDMLQRAVEYVLADPDADVPVRVNAEWDTPVKFATIAGKVTAATALDYDGNGKLFLVVATDKDSKLFAWADGKLQEVAQKHLLPPLTAQMPIDLAKVADAGAAGPVFYADFDGDGLPDILQTFEKFSNFYRGTAPGKFAEPVKTRLFLGKGRSMAEIGDYDADGLLDVFTSSEDGNHLWHNLGGSKFVDTLSVSGEITYISKPGGIDGIVCDINNDGRQDIFIAYADMTPHIFFDRGFRSFGHAHGIDLGEQKLVEDATKGQQAGTVADFTGDGAQDMVIVLKNGDAWLLPRKTQSGKALSVSVALGKDAPSPLLVTGYNGKRCLGAWNVTAGGAPAFFGLTDAGTLTLKWKLRDGTEKSASVNVIDRPVRYVIGQ